jgi:hypothetical protein
MWIAAGPGPEFPDIRADGSGPFDAKALAGRAWLAALPDEPAAQRRVMVGLADRYEAEHIHRLTASKAVSSNQHT